MEKPAIKPAYQTLLAQRAAQIRAEIAGILTHPSREWVLEIGAGHGHFLNAYADAHPGRVCLGVDIIADRIDRALRKRNRAKLPNLHFIHAEAGLFLENLPADVVFSDIFILFPDPWPKKRHHKNRIMRPTFLSALAGRAGQGSRLCFRTDYEPYFLEAKEAVAQHPDWDATDTPWPFEFETVFQCRAPRHFSFVAERGKK